MEQDRSVMVTRKLKVEARPCLASKLPAYKWSLHTCYTKWLQQSTHIRRHHKYNLTSSGVALCIASTPCSLTRHKSRPMAIGHRAGIPPVIMGHRNIDETIRTSYTTSMPRTRPGVSRCLSLLHENFLSVVFAIINSEPLLAKGRMIWLI